MDVENSGAYVGLCRTDAFTLRESLPSGFVPRRRTLLTVPELPALVRSVSFGSVSSRLFRPPLTRERLLTPTVLPASS